MNEQTSAKEGSELPRINSNLSTITHIKRWARKERKVQRNHHWFDSQPSYYKRWELEAPTAPP